MITEDPHPPKLPPGQDELPCDDGEPMETALHRVLMNLLIDSLSDAWVNRDDFYAGGNMFVYYCELQIKKHDFRGPDVFVVLDVEKKVRKSWVAWEEDGRLPDVVIELTSDGTRHVDRVDKKRLYARVWRLPAYFIYDPETAELEGFVLNAAGRDYVAVAPDARGDLPVPPLGLKLGVRQTQLHEYDCPMLRWIGSDGEPLPAPQERADGAEQRADRAEQRADSAEERANRAEAEVEHLQAELDRLPPRQ